MSNKKQTAVEWIEKTFKNYQKDGEKMSWQQVIDIVCLAKQLEKDILIDFMQSLKDYTLESRNILGHDEREASEFVEIFLTNKYKTHES